MSRGPPLWWTAAHLDCVIVESGVHCCLKCISHHLQACAEGILYHMNIHFETSVKTEHSSLHTDGEHAINVNLWMEHSTVNKENHFWNRSPYRDLNDRILPAFLTTGIQYWFPAVALAYRESFDDNMDCRWWRMMNIQSLGNFTLKTCDLELFHNMIFFCRNAESLSVSFLRDCLSKVLFFYTWSYYWPLSW